MSHVHVCEARAHAILKQSSGGSFSSYPISVAFAHWNFLLHAAKKNNNAVKFFVCSSQPTSPTCVVWCWHLKDLPRQERVCYTQVFRGQ